MSVDFLPLYLQSILSNPFVPCHYIPQANVTKTHVAPSNLRNHHVTLSSLRFDGHIMVHVYSCDCLASTRWDQNPAVTSRYMCIIVHMTFHVQFLPVKYYYVIKSSDHLNDSTFHLKEPVNLHGNSHPFLLVILKQHNI